MKEKLKALCCMVFLLCTLPYLITIVLQGKKEKADYIPVTAVENVGAEAEDSREIETYLVGIVAEEMPISYEIEALKAQAVIARTNVLAAREENQELTGGMSREQLLKLWGQEDFEKNYQKLTTAINATQGEVMRYQEGYIYAAFHAVSAGSTRSAAETLGTDTMPWLVGVDSTGDIPAEDYLKVIFLEKQELIEKIENRYPQVVLEPENPLGGIVINARDVGDYVTQVQLGTETITGEEFRQMLGLNSACFYMKEVEGKIRIVTKGLGHGLGLSQYGANELARQGSDYLEILNYYFKNVEISD